MESDKQSLFNINPSHYSFWKYLLCFWVGEVALITIEYFIVGNDIHNILDVSKYNLLIWWLGFLVANLVVAMIVIFIPTWHELRFLKTALLALSCCLSVILLFAILYFFKISNEVVIFLLFPLSDLSLILSILGLVWAKEYDKKGKPFNPKLDNAIKISVIGLGLSLLSMYPQFIFLSSAY